MKLLQIDDFLVYESERAGSNVRGNKRTNGIQVRQTVPGGYLLLATYRYPIGAKEKRLEAIEKAKNYIKEQI